MKTNTIIGIILLFISNITFAQLTDDMEWSSGNCQNHWIVGFPLECPYVATGGGHTGEQSGYMPNDGLTDNVLDLGSKIFGTWAIEFWMYVPAGREAYWNLQGEIPIGTGEWIVGNIFFNQDGANPGMGLIDDTALGAVSFDFPHDNWFRIAMYFDITFGIGASTWGMSVDNEIVIPQGTPFTNSSGTYPTSLGGIDFVSE